jgi:DNA polymerase-1
MTKTIYLVDASAFIHRSYHAIRHLSTKDGRPTNAVYGFLATLNKLLKDKKPEYLAVAYDAKGPGFRHEMFPEYKANRPPMPEDLIAQQEPIRKIVEALGLPSVEINGLEADDLIATLCRKALDDGYQVVIVSADKDFYQLLSDDVAMYDPNPKRESAMDVAALKEKLGLTPGEFLEAQGLMGDSTDNIPGVPGVGEKTAAKLIGEYHNLENLYEHVEDIKQKKLKENLIEYKQSAFLSRDLARLKADADLDIQPDGLTIKEPDVETLKELYRDLEFNRFLADLEPLVAIEYDDYHLVSDSEALESLVKELAGAKVLSVDLETTSLDPMLAEIVGMSLCAKPGRSFYLPVGHETLGAQQLSWDQLKESLQNILEDANLPKVGQNVKYDYVILRRRGVELGPIHDDPMVASYLIDPGAGGHGLDNLSRTLLGHDPITYTQVTGGKKGLFQDISPEAARDYACEDADLALRLAEVLRETIESEDLVRLYEDLELPLIQVLADMEMNGVGLDTDLLNDLSKEFSVNMDRIEKSIHSLAGREFNINSPKQLGEVLFEDLGLTPQKKTRKKSGYSTDVEVLTELALVHELPAEVLAYRSLSKLKSTYVDALITLINPHTGRVHTSFNQAVTATGRLSSSDPNLQNIPVRTDEGRRIRQAFIPGPGAVILSADYSQIELRILAHYSGDANLQEAFINGDDIHTRTAAEVFGLMPGMVDSNMRREAKAINFGIVYGLGPFGLAKQLGIEQKQAKAYIEQYFKRYSGVKEFIDGTLEEARRTGMVTTMLGRRRRLPELNSKNYQVRSMAERMAVNTPIQGSAADVIKLAMLAVQRRLLKEKRASKMILQVHDELVFEVPHEELDTMYALVKEEMEGVMKLAVPLIVDVSHGSNWAEAH